MTRLLAILFWCVIAYLLIRAWQRRSKKPESMPSPDSKTMVPCARCGVYVPDSEALMGDGQAYCSSGHRRLGPTIHD